MSRKYLKFGLRADKNLSDLTDKPKALDNILNNIASSVDTEGNLLGFNNLDISALIGMSQTGLGNDNALNVTGQPIPLVRLAGETVVTTSVDGDTVLVEPRVTIQDKINIHKNVMGDPPFINGGSGPNATFIPGDRLNSNVLKSLGTLHPETTVTVGQRYSFTGSGPTNPGYATIVAALNGVSGESRATPAGSASQTLSVPHIIIAANGVDYTAIGAETNAIGSIYIPTSTTNLGGTNRAQISLAADQAVQGTKYTITQVGDANITEWVALGCTTFPTVGTQFTAAVAGSEITATTSYITPHWIIGNDLVAASTVATTWLKLRTTTLPSGNAGTVSPNALESDKFYTSKVDSALVDLETSGDFWDDAVFDFPGTIHPKFTTQFGGVQWEGYQDDQFFRLEFNTTGFALFEEDLYDDNTWRTIRAITTEDVYPMSRVRFYSNINNVGTSVTRVELTHEEDYIRLAEGMSIEISGNSGTIETLGRYDGAVNTIGAPVLYRYYADLDIDMSVTENTGTYLDPVDSSIDLKFTWGLSSTVSTGETLDFTVPATGKRRHVRYSVFWPVANEPYRSKILSEVLHSATALNFNYIYKTNNNVDFSSEKFSFPFFMERKLGPRSQLSTFSTKVDGRISIEYVPTLETASRIKGIIDPGVNNRQNSGLISRLMRMTEPGVLEPQQSGTDIFPTGKEAEGQWLVIKPNVDSPTDTYAYQIIKAANRSKATVADDYLAKTGLSINADHGVIVVDNLGLIGIYKHGNTAASGVSDSDLSFADFKLTPEKLDTGSLPSSAMNKDLSEISIGDLVHIVEHSPQVTTEPTVYSHQYAFTVVQIDTDNTVHLKAHPDNQNDIGDSAGGDQGLVSAGIMAVYSSKGMDNRSSRSECVGVFGKEVSEVSASSTTTTIKLKNTDGISGVNIAGISASTADYVYLDGHIPTGAYVVSVSATEIVLSVAITAIINPGQTVVFVKRQGVVNDAGYQGVNKEYCVIPLNTAPPFISTVSGLQTPSSNPSLIAKELSFKQLQISTPTANVGPRGTGTPAWNGSTGTVATNSPTKYFSIYYDEPT